MNDVSKETLTFFIEPGGGSPNFGIGTVRMQWNINLGAINRQKKSYNTTSIACSASIFPTSVGEVVSDVLPDEITVGQSFDTAMPNLCG
jgi:hypothetical protein